MYNTTNIALLYFMSYKMNKFFNTQSNNGCVYENGRLLFTNACMWISILHGLNSLNMTGYTVSFLREIACFIGHNHEMYDEEKHSNSLHRLAEMLDILIEIKYVNDVKNNYYLSNFSFRYGKNETKKITIAAFGNHFEFVTNYTNNTSNYVPKLLKESDSTYVDMRLFSEYEQKKYLIQNQLNYYRKQLSYYNNELKSMNVVKYMLTSDMKNINDNIDSSKVIYNMPDIGVDKFTILINIKSYNQTCQNLVFQMEQLQDRTIQINQDMIVCLQKIDSLEIIKDEFLSNISLLNVDIDDSYFRKQITDRLNSLFVMCYN